MKENIFTFTKAQILKDMANECCSTCWNLCKTPYWKKLKDLLKLTLSSLSGAKRTFEQRESLRRGSI